MNIIKFKSLKIQSLTAVLIPSLCLLLASKVMGATPCDSELPECVPIGKWDFSLSLGYGSRSNPVISSDSVPIVLLPGVSYYGERFFWDNDFMGYTLNDSPTHMFNIIGTISYDQVFFNRWGVGNFFIESGFSNSSISGDFSGISFNGGKDEPEYNASVGRNLYESDFPPLESPVSAEEQALREAEVIDLDELHDRDVSGLMGLEYLYINGNWSVALQLLQDVTSVNDGKQARVSGGYGFLAGRSMWNFNAGVEWKDSKTLDYYYGIREDEVENPENAYHVRGDASYYVKADWEYKFNDNWSWMAVIHQRWLGSDIQDSPLIEESTVTTVFTGGVYHF
ncbi:Outer membrane protein OmpV [Thalassocella blandensis]|nr:Outer membrane protein OmpV [Thalassocella blandensis]